MYIGNDHIRNYPEVKRPRLRAHVYRSNLMAAKGAHLFHPGVYRPGIVFPRCPWCDRPAVFMLMKWPGMCADCGALLDWYVQDEVMARWTRYDGEGDD